MKSQEGYTYMRARKKTNATPWSGEKKTSWRRKSKNKKHKEAKKRAKTKHDVEEKRGKTPMGVFERRSNHRSAPRDEKRRGQLSRRQWGWIFMKSDLS